MERIAPRSLRETFAINLRAKRLGLGLSQEALAAASGLHRTYVGSVERGERNLGLDNIERLSAALSIDPADLLRNDACC